MAVNRYAEMVRRMAWRRIKNSRSSAQPGMHSHDDVQATVTPVPDAEPPPGSGQNTGIGGTTHAVADTGRPSAAGPAHSGPRAAMGRRLRPIRYAHAGHTEPADDDDTAGLVYEAAQDDYSEVPLGEPDEPDESVRNDGLGIFGGVATTEVPDEASAEASGRQPAQPRSAPEPERVIPIGAAWNQTITPPPVASSGPQERRQGSFWRIRGARTPEDSGPRVSVRDLPPDVQLRFIRDRVIIAAVVGIVSFIFLRSWPLSLTLVIIVWVLDTMRRSRSAVLYVNGGQHPGARKATSKQLKKMRREGYFTLDARPIPDSREVIDHLVIGPTGVYAIDSEKWDPKLPIRTWNGKKLYHGPESQKDRLEHAVWEASQASEILSEALGTEITVRPALAIYGPRIPWDMTTIRNVDVFTGSALGKYLKARKRKDGVTRLTREEVRSIYDTATRLLPDVSTEGAYSRVG